MKYLSLVFLIFQTQGCSQSVELYSFIGRTMGTTYSVKVYSSSEVDVIKLQAATDKKLVEFNQLLSTYISDSEITLINQSELLTPIPISKAFAENLRVSKELFEKSNGLYDVSIAPLVDRWKFGAKKFKDWKFPSEIELAEIKKCIGFDQISFGENWIKKSLACNQVDFSSLAKGQGVDIIVNLLKENNHKNFMVEIGGEVRVLGKKNGKPWRIGIESPGLDGGVSMVLSLKSGECVATSGGYRNFFVHEGKRYSHTINPHTGMPVEHRTSAVTVIAKNCILADAWATAFMVLGHEKSFEIAENEGLWARFMLQDGDSFKAVKTHSRN